MQERIADMVKEAQYADTISAPSPSDAIKKCLSAGGPKDYCGRRRGRCVPVILPKFQQADEAIRRVPVEKEGKNEPRWTLPAS